MLSQQPLPHWIQHHDWLDCCSTGHCPCGPEPTTTTMARACDHKWHRAREFRTSCRSSACSDRSFALRYTELVCLCGLLKTCAGEFDGSAAAEVSRLCRCSRESERERDREIVLVASVVLVRLGLNACLLETFALSTVIAVGFPRESEYLYPVRLVVSVGVRKEPNDAMFVLIRALQLQPV